MKARFIFLSSAMVLFLLGCKARKDTDVYTIVQNDGKVKRIIIQQSNFSEALNDSTPITSKDTSKALTSDFTIDSLKTFDGKEISASSPFKIDNTWDLFEIRDTTVSTDNIFQLIQNKTPFEKKTQPDSLLKTYKVFEKTFENYKDFEASYQFDTSYLAGKLERGVKVTDKFNWFFTNYQYTETYYALFKGSSLEKTFSPEDIRFLKLDDNQRASLSKDSLTKKQIVAAELKLIDWIVSTLANNYYNLLVQEVRNSPFQKHQGKIEQSKEIICNSDFKPEGFYTFISNNISNELAEWLKAPHNIAFRKLDIKGDIVNTFWGSKYINHVMLPGKIIHTNALLTKENIAQWPVELINFYTNNFEMTISSRVINIWPIITTVVIIIALIGLLSRRFLRKRDQ